MDRPLAVRIGKPDNESSHRKTQIAMQKNLKQLYLDSLYERVSKVKFLGEAKSRQLKEVFVELTIVEEYTRPRREEEILGLMDGMRRRRYRLFDGDNGEDRDKENKKQKRIVKPNELLHPHLKTIVTGSPGCGKTTLLKYLACKILEEKKRFPVFLELKTVTHESLKKDNHDLATFLFSSAVLDGVHPDESEKWRLKELFFSELRANNVSIFLDGFDEMRDEDLFVQLCHSITSFTLSDFGQNSLVISARPYALNRISCDLEQMEIAPLNQQQIEAFLEAYYLNDQACKKLLNELSQPNPLSEMIRIPILLSSIVELYREKQIFISDATRIDIYEAITKRLIARIDQEKSIQRFAFKIKDSDGTLKLDFLKQLAFDRLFTDEPEISGHHDTLRLVFKDEAILEKAKNYVRREGLSEINPIELTDDVKATALLREIGDDFYAFTHLTLHEYLAAKVLANHEDREKLFTLAYFNPSLVEMEVLPITLGLVNNAEHLYETLEQLSESLTYTNFRLQLRGLSYEARIENKRFLTITSRILNFMNEINLLESPYTESIIRSLIGIKGVRAEKIVEQISPLLEYEGENICLRTVRALEQLGNEKAVDSLIRALSNKNSFVRQEAAWALGKIEDMRAFDSLIVALDDVDAQVRGYVARALAKFRDEKASDDLLRAFRNVESGYRFRMEEALVDLGGEAIVHGLIEDLDNENRDVRFYAAKALGRIGNEKAVMPLINALNKDNSIPYAAAKALTEIGNKTAVAAVIKALESRERDVRQWVAEALGEHKRIEAVDELTRTLIFEDSGAAYRAAKILLQIGDEKAVDFMIKSLDSNDVLIKERAARALGMLKNHKAVDPLISMLNDEHANVRSRAAYALGEIRNGKAVAPLIQVLNDKNREVRENVVRALGVIADKRAVYPLSNALNDEDNQVREWALIALGKIGDEMASDALISALSDDDRDVRERAAYEAGQLGREESVDLLIKFLREGFKYGKRCVVEDSLGQVANEKAVNALIEALNSHDSSIRSGSAKALGQIGNEKATEAFIKALNSEDAGIRWHAARALEHVEENDLLKALEKSLKSKDHFTKRTAARVIGYYSLEPTLLDDLAQIAETEGIKEVRATAAVAKESFAHKLKIFGHMVTTGSMQPLSDTSTKEDVLVHEVGLLVSSAGHFFREFTKHDEGLDGEIEFRGEDGRGTGRRVYLQLKSGDSYLNVQKSGKEIFRISKPRHATYWASHAYPVFLVIRNSNGRIRWMNVTEYLNSRDSEVKQIEFQGSPFNIETIREMYLRYARE